MHRFARTSSARLEGAGLLGMAAQGNPSSASAQPVPGRLTDIAVKLALVRGLPPLALEQALNSSGGALLEWKAPSDECNESTLLANESVLSELLTLCPHRVPSSLELKGGFLNLDDMYSNSLSRGNNKKVQGKWAQLEADKIRAMMAYVRQLTRKSKTHRSRTVITPVGT
jgi:hypothetical protein